MLNNHSKSNKNVLLKYLNYVEQQMLLNRTVSSADVPKITKVS